MTDDERKTPLFYAVQQNDNEDVVRALIDAGADVNKTYDKGKTALFYALQQSNNEVVVHALIVASSDVNITDNEGKTALFYALQHRFGESVVLALINAGADVNITYNQEKSALFYAIQQSSNEDVVRAFNDAGADINITHNDGITALFYALQQSANEFVIRALIDAVSDVNITDNEGKTALFYAVQQSDNEVAVRALIDAGADVNITDNEGETALFHAVQQSENEGVVRALIGAGAHVNIADNEGKTALFYSVQYWFNERMVRALIDARADVNMTDDERKTPLFYAVQHRFNEGIVRALIDAGTDVNITYNEGKTALFYAVQRHFNEGVVRALVDAGADVNRTYNEGKTALFYAVQQSDNEDVVRALIDAGAHVNKTDNNGKTALIYAVQRRFNEGVVRALIDVGDDVNVTDNEGKTALCYAVQVSENEDVVRALKDDCADVDITDNEGKSALFYAVQQSDNEDVVRALKYYGADVNRVDNEGKTALFYAVQLDYEKVVRALIDAGARLNVRDNYGRTPLYYSITKSGSMTNYLLDRGANLCSEDNYSVLTFLIDKCYTLPADLGDGLKILVERKVVEKNQILEAMINVAFCKILTFNQSSFGVDVDSFSALLTLATDYTSIVDVRKREAIKTVLKTINEQGKRLIEPNVLSKVLRGLVKLGANLNSVDSNGNTALHHAIQLSFYGVPEETVIYICNQLKEMGASFHIKNLKKETPFLCCLVSTIVNISSHGCRQWSAVKTSLAVCQFLIGHGLNVKEKTQSGQSALHLILDLLRQVLLHAYEESRCLGDFIGLLQKTFIAHKEKGIPTVIKDDSGNTPLHIWATLELPPGQDQTSTKPISGGYTFQTLLKMILDHFSIGENKPQLDMKNTNGEAPLHLCRTWTAVELLLDAGANPKDVDSSGRSPLLVAAKNSNFVKNRGSLYPDILLAQDKFWRMVIRKGLNPWKVDIGNESVLSVLMESKSHDLARALIDVACDDNNVRSRPLILFSLLTAICKDNLPNAQWKRDAAEKILSSTKCPVNGKNNEDSPLHYCCRNIVEVKNASSSDDIKSTVHWGMIKLLRSFGADYRIPDATDQSCLDIAEECPALKDLLMEPIDLDRSPMLIKPWKSVSKTHERCLAKVARHLESNHIEPYWYHKDHLARGSFGAVYAGINEKDGREVAIKRILKFQLPRPQDQREITSLTALADCEQVVRYLSFFEDKDFSYIVLELMEGNLEDLLNKSISMKEREELCIDVIKGLSYMHGKQYLHRDLKPANILFKNSPKLCLKIADFGLSRHTDSTQGSTVYGTNAGTRCWIAPEILKATKDQHSTASDMFSCGLILHFILSVKKHPFSPENCSNKGELQICAETETNVMHDKKEGWDVSLSPEATNLVEQLLENEATKRPTAAESLTHPLFWPRKKKLDLLNAVGNQPEMNCPRAKVISTTAIENDLEARFDTIVQHMKWNDPGYTHMPAIYTEMMKGRKTSYDPFSTVELVRFIRNAYAHVSESTRSTPIRKQLLEDFVFLEYFPNLVMEVYKAVTTHGWDQTREEIKFAMKK